MAYSWRSTINLILLLAVLILPSIGRGGECLVKAAGPAVIEYNGSGIELPFMAEDCQLVRIKAGEVSIIFRDVDQQLQAVKLQAGDSILDTVNARQDSGFLKRAFRQIAGADEIARFGGKRLSSQAFYPGLPYDDVYIDRDGITISDRQYYIEDRGLAGGVARTDFRVTAITIADPETGKTMQFQATPDQRLIIPAAALAPDREYVWRIQVGPETVTGRFYTLEEQENRELAGMLAELHRVWGPTADREIKDLLSADLFDKMGCDYQSQGLLNFSRW